MYVDFPVFGFMTEEVMMNNLSRLLINTIGMNCGIIRKGLMIISKHILKWKKYFMFQLPKENNNRIERCNIYDKYSDSINISKF